MGSSNVLEKSIEQKLVREVRQRGGLCLKFVSPGFDGVPDRIVLMPKGRMAFVEVKAPGRKPERLQAARHEMLQRLGFRVYVLDRAEQIGGVIDAIQTT